MEKLVKQILKHDDFWEVIGTTGVLLKNFFLTNSLKRSQIKKAEKNDRENSGNPWNGFHLTLSLLHAAKYTTTSAYQTRVRLYQ